MLAEMLGALRMLVELAGFFLLGQGCLYVLAGAGRAHNPFYRLFSVLTRPAIRLTRAVLPRQIVDRHVPVVAFFLLFWLWIALAYVRQAI